MQDRSSSNSAINDARALRLAVVTSQYHDEITYSMRDAATEAFLTAGGLPHSLAQFDSPGAFELTAICRALALEQSRMGRSAFDAIVALGCIITGETTHDQYIAQSVTHGLTSITVQTGVPIAFGVLTCHTIEQARARSIEAVRHHRTNKGAEAMMAAIHTANTIRRIETTGGMVR